MSSRDAEAAVASSEPDNADDTDEIVRRGVFDFLLFCDDTSNITTGDIKRHLLDVLMVPTSYFLDSDGRNNMKNAIIEYETTRIPQRTYYKYEDYLEKYAGPEKKIENAYKTLRFTKVEQEALASYVENYIEDTGLPIEALSRDLKSEVDEVVDKQFWEDLQLIFPEKKMQSLKTRVSSYVMLKLGRSRVLQAGELQQIKQLVDLHGRKWQKIGSLMGLSPAKVRQQYLDWFKYNRQVEKGHWTAEERARLLQVVKVLTSCQDELDTAKIPVYGMEWRRVQHLMGDRRRASDYARAYDMYFGQRADHSQRDGIINRAAASTSSGGGLTRAAGSTKNVLKLLEFLHPLHFQHVSEVNFAAIGRVLRIGRLWNLWGSLERECPDDLSFDRKVSLLLSKYTASAKVEFEMGWQLKLLEWLNENDISNGTDGSPDDGTNSLAWQEADRQLEISGSLKRWHTLQKECPRDNTSVSDFDEKVEYLLKKYRAQKETDDEAKQKALDKIKKKFTTSCRQESRSLVGSSSSGNSNKSKSNSRRATSTAAAAIGTSADGEDEAATIQDVMSTWQEQQKEEEKRLRKRGGTKAKRKAANEARKNDDDVDNEDNNEDAETRHISKKRKQKKSGESSLMAATSISSKHAVEKSKKKKLIGKSIDNNALGLISSSRSATTATHRENDTTRYTTSDDASLEASQKPKKQNKMGEISSTSSSSSSSKSSTSGGDCRENAPISLQLFDAVRSGEFSLLDDDVDDHDSGKESKKKKKKKDKNKRDQKEQKSKKKSSKSAN